jgi:hypothetical protein
MRRELPLLIVEISLLVVLLHANAPEVWFWFAVLVVLLAWRGWAWCWRRQRCCTGRPRPARCTGR